MENLETAFIVGMAIYAGLELKDIRDAGRVEHVVEHVESTQAAGSETTRAICNKARRALARSKIGIIKGMDFWQEPPTKEDIEALNCP